MKRTLALVLGLSLTLVARAEASEEARDRELAIDPAQAGPDYKVQGEYTGEVTAGGGKQPLAAQVIALGGGDFHIVYLPGGLPGAGWDGKTRIVTPDKGRWWADGKTQGGQTVFTTPYTATLAGDTLTGKTSKGESFELKKTARHSPTEGAAAPAGAVVLFDGSNLDHWKGGQLDERKLIATAHGGAFSKEKLTNFTLHVEYMVSFMPYAREQERANSGVYLQNRYEIQVLDSFGLKPNAGDAGAVYSKAAPKLNMCFPPLTWQTYDIDFQAAQFDGDKKVKNAVVSVKHNGVPIHENYEIPDKTGGGDKEAATPGSIQLQGHGNPVFFRNVWCLEKK